MGKSGGVGECRGRDVVEKMFIGKYKRMLFEMRAVARNSEVSAYVRGCLRRYRARDRRRVRFCRVEMEADSFRLFHHLYENYVRNVYKS